MTLKEFMNDVWTATVVNSCEVVDRRVCYGSEPDIQFTVKTQDGDINFVSAKEMFEKEMEYV